MARIIRVTSSGSIQRPLEEVRQQFADMTRPTCTPAERLDRDMRGPDT